MQILALYDLEQRVNITFPGVRIDQRPNLIRYINETGNPHFILYSRLVGANVEAEIAGEQAYFNPLGEVEWKVYAHDYPADLRDRLVACGFKADEAEAIMALDLIDNLGIEMPLLQDGVTLLHLHSAAQLADVRRVWEQVWEEDSAR